jgi:hypothetical protein
LPETGALAEPTIAQALHRFACSAESGGLCYGINWHDERSRRP